MATIQAEIKRGFLRSIYRNATKIASPLVTELEAFQDFCFSTDLKRGRLLSSSSGNNHAVGFQQLMTSFQLTQDQVFALSEEFMAIYEYAVSQLNIQGNATPTDAQIFAQMLLDDRMASVRCYQKDYTSLRFPEFGPSAAS